MAEAEELREQKEEPEEALPTAAEEKVGGASKVFLTFGERSCVPRPELQAAVIIQNKAHEHCRSGKEAVEKSQFERAVSCFSKAVHLQPDQPEPYVLQGEAYLQLCDFQSAALCYKRAGLLQPGVHSDRLAFIYYLQGQCLLDRGLLLDALESFRKASAVRPGCRAYDYRSVVCLSALGQGGVSLRLVTEWMERDGPTAELYVLRARLHQQLDQTSQCFQDVKCALELNPSCPEGGALLQQLKGAAERARQAAVDRTLVGELSQALSFINLALEHLPQDPHLYLFRGTLYRRLKDFTAAIEDLLQAMELSESRAGTWTLRDHPQIRAGTGTLRDHAQIRAGTGTLRDHPQIRAGTGTLRDHPQIRAGTGTLRDDAQIRAGTRTLRDHPQIRAGTGTLRDHAQISAGTGTLRDDAQIGAGSGTLRDDAQIGAGSGTLRDHVQFQLVLTYNDFSIECFCRGLYNEATALLSKAIEEEKNQAGLYINRGDCFFKQKAWLYALADYLQAEEIVGPNDPTVRQRLSVFHRTEGNICFKEGRFKDAVSSFSQAVLYDPTVSWVYEMRSKAHRKLSSMDQAREDFIRALVLDPDNDELPAMSMSLFPGYRFVDVLSTRLAQTVRVQLEDTVQTYGSDQLSKKPQTPPSVWSEEESELQLCVNQPELNLTLDK